MLFFLVSGSNLCLGWVKLWFSACRNGLMPKKLHLEIALGNVFPKEGNYFQFYFNKKSSIFTNLPSCSNFYITVLDV